MFYVSPLSLNNSASGKIQEKNVNTLNYLWYQPKKLFHCNKGRSNIGSILKQGEEKRKNKDTRSVFLFFFLTIWPDSLTCFKVTTYRNCQDACWVPKLASERIGCLVIPNYAHILLCHLYTGQYLQQKTYLDIPPSKKPYLPNLDLHPAKRFKIPITDDTWARSTWAADAVGPVLGWGGLGSQSVGRPGRPWFSWSGPRWHDLTRAAGGWGRSTHGNTRREPALVLGPTWPYRCSTLW